MKKEFDNIDQTYYNIEKDNYEKNLNNNYIKLMLELNGVVNDEVVNDEVVNQMVTVIHNTKINCSTK